MSTFHKQLPYLLFFLTGALIQALLVESAFGWSQQQPSQLAPRQAAAVDANASSRNVMPADVRRRDLLRNILCIGASGISLFKPSAGSALVEEGEQRMVFREKPTAPVEALVPAIQQRLLLEAALELAKALKKGNGADSTEITQKLQSILPPLGDDLSLQPDVRVLKHYNPAQILRGDLVRATMNLYTTNLNYNNLLGKQDPMQAYDVTDPQWKKSYIRNNDGLPDISKLIGADLDLRYLYRNQVQLKLDDASAELYYSGEIDVGELVACLQEAQSAFDQWLDRIRYGDVREALALALQGKTAKVYDSWAAGFVPPTPWPASFPVQSLF